jgi:hypothetical protein
MRIINAVNVPKKFLFKGMLLISTRFVLEYSLMLKLLTLTVFFLGFIRRVIVWRRPPWSDRGHREDDRQVEVGPRANSDLRSGDHLVQLFQDYTFRTKYELHLKNIFLIVSF